MDIAPLLQVVVLRSLRSKLAEALAEVHSTAASLHLRVARDEDGADHHASSSGENGHTELLFQQARKAIIQTSNSCSEVTVFCIPCILEQGIIYGYQTHISLAQQCQSHVCKICICPVLS